MVFIIGEGSGPFLLLHQVFRSYKETKTLSNSVGFVFCVAYLILRIILGPSFLYYMSYKETLLFRVFLSLGMFVSYWWGIEIILKLMRGVGDILGIKFFRDFSKSF